MMVMLNKPSNDVQLEQSQDEQINVQLSEQSQDEQLNVQLSEQSQDVQLSEQSQDEQLNVQLSEQSQDVQLNVQLSEQSQDEQIQDDQLRGQSQNEQLLLQQLVDLNVQLVEQPRAEQLNVQLIDQSQNQQYNVRLVDQAQVDQGQVDQAQVDQAQVDQVTRSLQAEVQVEEDHEKVVTIEQLFGESSIIYVKAASPHHDQSVDAKVSSTCPSVRASHSLRHHAYVTNKPKVKPDSKTTIKKPKLTVSKRVRNSEVTYVKGFSMNSEQLHPSGTLIFEEVPNLNFDPELVSVVEMADVHDYNLDNFLPDFAAHDNVVPPAAKQVNLSTVQDTMEVTIETMDNISDAMKKEKAVLNVPTPDDGMQTLEVPPLYHAVRVERLLESKPYTVRSRLPKQSDYTVSVSHTGLETYHCKFCSYKGKHFFMLARHLEAHNEDGAPFKCSRCSFTASLRCFMKAHQRKHDVLHPCGQCTYQASSLRDIQRHQLRHTDEKPYKCDLCDYACRQQKSMIVHRRKHTGQNYVCEYPCCTYKTPCSSTLKGHVQRVHAEKRKYICLHCPYRTNHKAAYDKHIKCHLGLKDHKCPHCDYTAVSSAAIRRHMNIHSVEKSLYCDRCLYATRHESSLRVHLMKHENLKPYSCSLCSYDSCAKSRVMRHIKKQHKLSPRAGVIYSGLGLKINFDEYKNKNLQKDESKVVKLKYTAAELATITIDDDNVGRVESVRRLNQIMIEKVICEDETRGAVYQCRKCKFSCQSESALATHKLTYHGSTYMRSTGTRTNIQRQLILSKEGQGHGQGEGQIGDTVYDDAVLALASLQAQVELSTS